MHDKAPQTISLNLLITLKCSQIHGYSLGRKESVHVQTMSVAFERNQMTRILCLCTDIYWTNSNRYQHNPRHLKVCRLLNH